MSGNKERIRSSLQFNSLISLYRLTKLILYSSSAFFPFQVPKAANFSSHSSLFFSNSNFCASMSNFDSMDSSTLLCRTISLILSADRWLATPNILVVSSSSKDDFFLRLFLLLVGLDLPVILAHQVWLCPFYLCSTCQWLTG